MLARLYAHRRDFLLPIRLRMRARGIDPSERLLVPGRTRLCIEGYPRSGNSFAARMFLEANPVPIAHHTHAIANVKAARRAGVPVLVLMRAPEDAILSHALYSPGGRLGWHVEEYVHFYEHVAKRAPDAVVARFETVTGDFNKVLEALNARHGAGFRLLPDVKAAEAKVRKDIEARYAGSDDLRAKRSHRIPVPDEGRKAMREQVRPALLAHPRLPAARKAYEAVLSAGKWVV